METRPLTRAQAEVYIALKGFYDREGKAPTLHEAADLLGFTTRPVVEHLEAIQRRGWIRRTPHEARGIEFLRSTEEAMRSLYPEVPNARACMVLMG